MGLGQQVGGRAGGQGFERADRNASSRSGVGRPEYLDHYNWQNYTNHFDMEYMTYARGWRNGRGVDLISSWDLIKFKKCFIRV